MLNFYRPYFMRVLTVILKMADILKMQNCFSNGNSNNSSLFRLRFSPPSVGLKAANDKNASGVPCHREPIAM